MVSKTISRNTKAFAQILDSAVDIQITNYSAYYNDYYSSVEAIPDFDRQNGKLTLDPDTGQYTLRVHSNYWIRFYTPDTIPESRKKEIEEAKALESRRNKALEIIQSLDSQLRDPATPTDRLRALERRQVDYLAMFNNDERDPQDIINLHNETFDRYRDSKTVDEWDKINQSRAEVRAMTDEQLLEALQPEPDATDILRTMLSDDKPTRLPTIRDFLTRAMMDFKNDYLTLEAYATANGISQNHAKALLWLAEQIATTKHPEA
jgi:hypothetical protein